jgi:pSer/pThr/pTyr-binding forkhead associated (FHA) protein
MTTSIISVLVVQDLEGTRAYKLDRNIYFIGRSKQSDIQIFDSQASRTHATLIRMMQPSGEFSYRVLDGDARTGKPSQNGTQLNNRALKIQDLNNRDCLIFGPRAKAIYFYLDSQFEYDLLSAPERWMREQVNQPQEKETLVVNLVSDALSLVPIQAEVEEEVVAYDSLSAKTNRQMPAPLGVHQVPNLKLGQFFVRSARVKAEQLQLALRLQANSKKRLGEVMVEQGWVTKEEVKPGQSHLFCINCT